MIHSSDLHSVQEFTISYLFLILVIFSNASAVSNSNPLWARFPDNESFKNSPQLPSPDSTANDLAAAADGISLGGASTVSTLSTMAPSLSNSNPSLAGSVAGPSGRPVSLPTDGKTGKGKSTFHTLFR